VSSNSQLFCCHVAIVYIHCIYTYTRLQTQCTYQAKLANEILGSAVDGALPLVAQPGVSDATRCKAESVCRDALQVLTGPGLKVGKGTAANGK
jgi:hypothetical protein